MFLVKLCPACHKKIRFPIDKGKINVKCQCGYQFTADPDSSELYQEAQFDLHNKTGSKKKLFSIQKLIKNLYDFKYDLQNFKLLPGVKQKKVLLFFFLLLGLFMIVVLIITKVFL